MKNLNETIGAVKFDIQKQSFEMTRFSVFIGKFYGRFVFAKWKCFVCSVDGYRFIRYVSDVELFRIL